MAHEVEVRERVITVRVDHPTDVTPEEIAEFVQDALETMGGSRHPDDPLFCSLSVKAVRIGKENFLNENPKELY